MRSHRLFEAGRTGESQSAVKLENGVDNRKYPIRNEHGESIGLYLSLRL